HTHQETIDRRVAETPASEAVDFFLGSGAQRLWRRAEKLDDAVTRFATKPLIGERIEQTLLHDVGLALGPLACAPEFAANDLGFGAGTQRRAGAHRKRTRRSRRKRGKEQLQSL